MLIRFFRALGLFMVLGSALVLAPSGHAKYFEVGQNFTGIKKAEVTFRVPDTMGSVGPDHVMEFINGRYAVFNKSGTRLTPIDDSTTLDGFWAGLGIANTGAFDPRIIYDKNSQRWFASAATGLPALLPGNNILLAVSKSANPLNGWTAFSLPINVGGTVFVDFPSLGLNRDGVIIACNNYIDTTPDYEFHSVSLVSIPKKNLIQAVPTVANLTAFQGLNAAGIGFSLQPAVDFGPSKGRSTILAVDSEEFDLLNRTNILGVGASGASLTPKKNIPVPTTSEPPLARQPGGPNNIDSGDDRFSGNVVVVGDSLWAAHSITFEDRAAIRWYEIDESNNNVKQLGTIGDPLHDYYYPSLAVNQFGDVVIGYTRSGETEFASAYASIGETMNDVTIFGAPTLLKAGLDSYENKSPVSGLNRWGDYSATVCDPNDPFTFWTFQEWADFDLDGIDQWATQITEIRIVPLPGTIWLAASGLGLFALLRVKRLARS